MSDQAVPPLNSKRPVLAQVYPSSVLSALHSLTARSSASSSLPFRPSAPCPQPGSTLSDPPLPCRALPSFGLSLHTLQLPSETPPSPSLFPFPDPALLTQQAPWYPAWGLSHRSSTQPSLAIASSSGTSNPSLCPSPPVVTPLPLSEPLRPSVSLHPRQGPAAVSETFHQCQRLAPCSGPLAPSVSPRPCQGRASSKGPLPPYVLAPVSGPCICLTDPHSTPSPGARDRRRPQRPCARAGPASARKAPNSLGDPLTPAPAAAPPRPAAC